MLEFTEKKKKVELEFLNQETQVHVKLGEAPGRKPIEERGYWVTVHFDNDCHHNSIDLVCKTEEEAKEVATLAYEFLTAVKPKLLTQRDETHEHSHCIY
jgi:hypothetical protein